jgi:hypothetical protein
MNSRADQYAVRKEEFHCPRRERKSDFPVFQPISMSLHRQPILFSISISYIYCYYRLFFTCSFLRCRTSEKLQPTCVKPTTTLSVLHFATTVSSSGEETGLAAYSGGNVSPRLLCPSPLARVQAFADSLTSVSVHAYIYKIL